MRIFIDVRLQATQLTYSNHADFAQLAKMCCQLQPKSVLVTHMSDT